MRVKIFFLTVSLYIVGCKQKEESLMCRIVPASSDLIDCYSTKNTNFRFYFNRDKEIQKAIILNENCKGYEDIEFYVENNRLSVKSINVNLDKCSYKGRVLLYYNAEGNLLSSQILHNEIQEKIHRVRINNTYEYYLSYYFPNLKKGAQVYHFTLSQKGELLPGFFFYKQNKDKSYSILTDDELLIEKGMVDSLEIAYNEVKIEDMEFEFIKERDAYFPLFYKDKMKIVKSIDSVIRFENESSIIGTLWCFLPKEDKFKTTYNLLIFNGDPLTRVKEDNYLFDKYEKKYPTGKISELKDLKKSLLQVGFIEKKGGFEPSSDLLEKVQSVIDGSKNNAHSKGS